MSRPAATSPNRPEASVTAGDSVDADACYRALQTHDARFDGRFFIGVTSTGIYCRPVCKVRTPKQENCRFFDLAAQAERAGFRPCLRCRPELSPTTARNGGAASWSMHSASSVLAQQAAQLLDHAADWCNAMPTATTLAQRLGVSERHLRRIFEAHWGVTAMQYLQTRRLLLAKQLLTDTHLPVAQVALHSGFNSVRRFNACFLDHYRMAPSALRSATLKGTGSTVSRADRAKDLGAEAGAITLKASYRPPYDVAAMLGFFATRCIQGMELVDIAQRSYARTVALLHGGALHTGWLKATFETQSPTVRVQICASLGAVLPLVLSRVRDLLDLDADPLAIDQQLAPFFADASGLRVPGTVDGFELAVRAILGQQITVAAARTLAARLVDRFGTPVVDSLPGLHHNFPSAQRLAEVTASDLGALGIVRQRQSAILALAHAVAEGRLVLDSSAPVQQTMEQLQALPGIGAWTASYIAMRALRWPDAFPAGDVALQSALGVRDQPQPARAAEAVAQAWRPWRSYGVLRAWAQLSQPSTQKPTTKASTST